MSEVHDKFKSRAQSYTEQKQRAVDLLKPRLVKISSVAVLLTSICIFLALPIIARNIPREIPLFRFAAYTWAGILLIPVVCLFYIACASYCIKRKKNKDDVEKVNA